MSLPTYLGLMKNGLLEEESIPSYRAEFFHRTSIGQVINGRYQIIAKLGYGAGSTVWLAHDTRKWWWQRLQYIALKIIDRSDGGRASALSEIEASRAITTTASKHEGRHVLRTVVDSFEISTPDGSHLALVYEPMRESMSLFQRRRHDRRLPADFLQAVVQILLTGLDCLHRECHIIHTDLKRDNILLGMERQSPIQRMIRDEENEPTPYKEADGRRIYFSRNFGDLIQDGIARAPGPPKIADFGLAVITNASLIHKGRIQPDRYQAPEVILEAGWSYSADIWNLGVMLWDMMENDALFDATDPETAAYSVDRHLEEMAILLGPPPSSLLNRAELAEQYFSPEGQLLRKHEDTTATTLENTITAIEGDEKKQFLTFVRKMLKWDPKERATAQELLKEPWVQWK